MGLSFAEALTVQRRETDLDQLAGLINWNKLAYRIERIVARAEGGRPAYDSLKMFKIMILQRQYDLSDRAAEEALYDRLSFRRFCGFGLDECLPDAVTILRFRTLLADKTASLLALVNGQLEAQGITFGKGSIIDATVIRSSSKKPPAGQVCATDPEAGWTKKKGAYVYGYKAHVSVEDEHGLIQATQATGADVHDSLVFGQLLSGDEAIVYADKAYDAGKHRKLLADHGIKDGILHKRVAHKALEPWKRQLNTLYAPIRQRVERTFAHLKGILGLARARYKTWAKNQVHFDLAAIAYNLKRALKLIPC